MSRKSKIIVLIVVLVISAVLKCVAGTPWLEQPAGSCSVDIGSMEAFYCATSITGRLSVRYREKRQVLFNYWEDQDVVPARFERATNSVWNVLVGKRRCV